MYSTSGVSSQYLQVAPLFGYPLSTLQPHQQNPLQMMPLNTKGSHQPGQYQQLNLPNLSAQPFSQSQSSSGAAPLHQPPLQLYKADAFPQHYSQQNGRQDLSYSLQLPDSPNQQANAVSDQRVFPQMPLLQAQPHHALLPRMLSVQQMLHPFQMQSNDYYVVSGGALQPLSGYQQLTELQFHVQPAMIPYYQQSQAPNQMPVASNGAGVTTGLSLLGIPSGSALAGAVQLQYPLLLLPNGNVSMRQNSLGGSAANSMYQAGISNGSYLTVSLQLSMQLSSLLSLLQYPMPGLITTIPSSLLSGQQMLTQSGPLMVQTSSISSPPVFKMSSAPYGGLNQKIMSLGTLTYNQAPEQKGNRQLYANGSAMSYNMTAGSALSKYGHGVKKNQCPVCQKIFKRPSSLQIHFYIHTGVKLYKCEWEGCGRLFNVKSNMTRHYKLHMKNEKE